MDSLDGFSRSTRSLDSLAGFSCWILLLILLLVLLLILLLILLLDYLALPACWICSLDVTLEYHRVVYTLVRTGGKDVSLERYVPREDTYQ